MSDVRTAVVTGVTGQYGAYLTRSPAFTGTSVGATTSQCTPNSLGCQYNTQLVGPAS